MRSTNSAPLALSNSYLTGSPPIGTSMMTLRLSGGLSPMGMRSMFMDVTHLEWDGTNQRPLYIAAPQNGKAPNTQIRQKSLPRRSEDQTSELQSLIRH